MILSDHIAKLIEQMLEDGGGTAEVKRNDLAEKIGCVPSQINYVITSRFTPERGYVIESRRGGGGYIRILRMQMTKSEYLMHVFQAVGDSLTERDAKAFLSAQVMSQAALERCPTESRDTVRADMMRRLLALLMM